VGIGYPVPIIIYASLALMFLLFSGRAKGLKCVFVASYCGVMITSFTGGVSGGIWLAPLLLFFMSPVAARRPSCYAFGSGKMVRLTYMIFLVFFAGVVIGLVRYDPAVEFAKGGSFRTLFGVPIRYLMMIYRLQTMTFLTLAFVLPLRYYIDRKLLLQFLMLCWVFTLVLAVLGILDFTGFADFRFQWGRLEEIQTGAQAGIFGFNRAAYGKMLITGMFICFAMTQLTRSYNLTILGYTSIPILVIALLFSFSRSSFVALAIGAVSLAVTLGGARAFKGILVSLFGLIVISIVLMQSPGLRERFLPLLPFLGGQQGGVSAAELSSSRIEGWAAVLKWLFSSPGVVMFGVGFQNFNYYIKVYAQVGALEGGHNSWLTSLAEFGILGFLLFNAWLVAIFSWLVSWRRVMTDKVDKMMPGIFISLMLGLVASCMFSETLMPAQGMVVWLAHFYMLLGIWISYYRTQMLENFADVEYFDGEQYVYDEYNSSDETYHEADQYYDFS
jgi:O-antigen ligase